jgi:hypothetical protein
VVPERAAWYNKYLRITIQQGDEGNEGKNERETRLSFTFQVMNTQTLARQRQHVLSQMLNLRPGQPVTRDVMEAAIWDVMGPTASVEAVSRLLQWADKYAEYRARSAVVARSSSREQPPWATPASIMAQYEEDTAVSPTLRAIIDGHIAEERERVAAIRVSESPESAESAAPHFVPLPSLEPAPDEKPGAMAYSRRSPFRDRVTSAAPRLPLFRPFAATALCGTPVKNDRAVWLDMPQLMPRDDDPGAQRCRKCHVVKMHAEFWRNSMTSTGYMASCISCEKIRKAVKMHQIPTPGDEK